MSMPVLSICTGFIMVGVAAVPYSRCFSACSSVISWPCVVMMVAASCLIWACCACFWASWAI